MISAIELKEKIEKKTTERNEAEEKRYFEIFHKNLETFEDFIVSNIEKSNGSWSVLLKKGVDYTKSPILQEDFFYFAKKNNRYSKTRPFRNPEYLLGQPFCFSELVDILKEAGYTVRMNKHPFEVFSSTGSPVGKDPGITMTISV